MAIRSPGPAAGAGPAASAVPGAPGSGLPALVRATIERHRALIANVLTLVGTTGLTLVLGFGYWNVAARLFSQDAVGYGSAAIAAMTFLSSFGTFGLNTLLVGELPGRTRRAGLIAAAMIAAAAGAAVLALAFVLIAPRISANFDDVGGSVSRIAVFCCGVGLSAASVVFDEAMIGLLRGGAQFVRNLAFVTTKMVTLIGAAIVLHYATGLGLFASWVAAIPVSLLVAAIRLRVAGGASVLPRPDWAVLRGLLRRLFAHNWLNFALQMPALLVPVVAGIILPPATNGAYYIAITVASVLYIVPNHMSTVLFALGAAEPAALPARLRFSLRVAAVVAVAGIGVLCLGDRLILSVFGPGYAGAAGGAMQLTALACLPSIPNVFYIAVARATNNLSRAAALVTGFACAEIAAAVAGAETHGVNGMCAAELAVMVAQALVTTPLVLRAAREPRRARHAAARTRSAAAARTDRQQAGLAVLMSLAVQNTVPMAAIRVDSGDPAAARRQPRRDRGAGA